jgi:pimeloyl-ACP methyl ester carboxylesterase
MERAILGEVELEYERKGTGEAVVLMHAGCCADWFKPLFEQPALNRRYCIVRHHRVGYAGSSHLAGSVTIAQHAAHCRALMQYLGIDSAHVVGHSSSANIALQLALDAPEAVQSLVLLEPALLQVPSAFTGARAFVASALEQYHAGAHAAAVDIWMQGTCSSVYRDALDRAIPHAFDQAVADATTFFAQELPAVQQWTLRREDALRITQPVLAVIGEKSKEVSPIWEERHQLLLDWLPHVEPFVLPNATHLLHVQNPEAMAERLATFFARPVIAATM